MKTLGNVEGYMDCLVTAWIILESHGANLAGSSNCYIHQGITESSGSAALELGCEELFPRNGGCINNAAKVQYENEGEGGILLQHL